MEINKNVFEALGAAGDPLISAACEAAGREAWNFELGPDSRADVEVGIRDRLQQFVRDGNLPDNTVLIGGPPCQAYSLVGRSRNRGIDGYKAEKDPKHFLYIEYLRVINEFRPAVFIMENVKGILTSRVSDQGIFQTIMTDLKRPDLACGQQSALKYVLVPIGHPSNAVVDPKPADFVVRAESYGVPQARHRVIICGVREDVFDRAGPPGALSARPPCTVGDVINDLPKLRSTLSFRGRGMRWIESLEAAPLDAALRSLEGGADPGRHQVAALIREARRQLHTKADPGTGAARWGFHASNVPTPSAHSWWYHDRPSTVLSNHECRSHMPEDIARYLFVAAFGEVTGRSPRLAEFPLSLLPRHKNVDPLDPKHAIFDDRFRVQVRNRFSSTVTSHIAKDGHAFIHPDPLQCRSMTVREAARLQTFPDSYVFLGNRTSQYTQVGNAVPPLLAFQIAEVVGVILTKAGLGGDCSS